jgi:hypothetical protein
MEDLNAQLIDWLGTVANARVHGTTRRVVGEAFAEEQDELQRLPEHRFNAVLKLERRVSHDGLVAVGGNYYSVPDRTRRVVPCTRALATVPSQSMSWALRSSILRKDRPRKKSSRI